MKHSSFGLILYEFAWNTLIVSSIKITLIAVWFTWVTSIWNNFYKYLTPSFFSSEINSLRFIMALLFESIPEEIKYFCYFLFFKHDSHKILWLVLFLLYILKFISILCLKFFMLIFLQRYLLQFSVRRSKNYLQRNCFVNYFVTRID